MAVSGAGQQEVSKEGRQHQVGRHRQGNGDLEALPDTHSLSPRRFYLHPEMSNDLVGTHPPGAHSLVAVSVGEVWPCTVPLFRPPGGLHGLVGA